METAVPEEVTTSPEDSLRDALTQAYDSHSREGAGGEALAPPTAPASPSAKLPEGGESSPVVPPTSPADPTVGEPEAPKFERSIPERLKAKLADKWATIPPEVREEFHSYESHVGAIASKYGKAAKAWEETQAAFAPYEQMVRAEGGNFQGALVNLFETARILRQGSPEQKIALLGQIQKTFNIPTSNVPVDPVTGQQAGEEHFAVSPELIDRINRLEQGFLTREQTEVNNARAKVKSELDTFLADPKRIYVQEPGYLDTMASLITAGKATGLDDAYSQAAWLHEGPRAAEIAKVNAAKQTPRIEQAARAKAVGVSVNGNSPGTVKLDPSQMSLRDTLSAAYSGDLN